MNRVDFNVIGWKITKPWLVVVCCVWRTAENTIERRRMKLGDRNYTVEILLRVLIKRLGVKFCLSGAALLDHPDLTLKFSSKRLNLTNELPTFKTSWVMSRRCIFMKWAFLCNDSLILKTKGIFALRTVNSLLQAEAAQMGRLFFPFKSDDDIALRV